MHNHIPLPNITQLAILSETVGAIFVAHGGKELYVTDSTNSVHLYTGPDWSRLSDDKISAWLAAHPLH